MAFIKPYYDHDQQIARQKQVYGRIKSLELIEKESGGQRLDYDHKQAGQQLAGQGVTYQLEQALFFNQENRKSPQSILQRFTSTFQRFFKMFA